MGVQELLGMKEGGNEKPQTGGVNVGVAAQAGLLDGGKRRRRRSSRRKSRKSKRKSKKSRKSRRSRRR
jgi:hypothetical protein